MVFLYKIYLNVDAKDVGAVETKAQSVIDTALAIRERTSFSDDDKTLDVFHSYIEYYKSKELHLLVRRIKLAKRERQ